MNRLFPLVSITKQLRKTYSYAALHSSLALRACSTATSVKKSKQDAVTVNINGQQQVLDNVWLRDNCRCAHCYNHQTHQKNIVPHHIPLNIQPSAVTHNRDTLLVTWSDGHQSQYDYDWLHENYYPGTSHSKIASFLWNKQLIQQQKLPVAEYKEVLSSDEGLKVLLKAMLKYGYGLVRGVPVNIEGTQQVAERVCSIQTTLFGTMWSFTADMERSDTAYTTLALGAHNDSTYFSIPSGIQVFHKLYHDGRGGETLLVDGFHAAEKMREENPDSFNLLSKYKVEHQYLEKGPNPHHCVSLAPILQVHPVHDTLQWIRYNHYDRSPIKTIPADHLPAYYKALNDLSKHIEDADNEHWLKLEPGTVLFVDNWRVLHGRAAFTGKRRICGCYLPNDEWKSKARILNLL